MRANIILILGLICSCFDTANAEPPQTNFVFFLVDDLGWADVGCNGSTFYETPNIDRLSATGMRFTQAYAACPVCSPTRASILTGRHPVRVDITDWIPGAETSRFADARFEHVDDRNNLALEEVTVAEVLKQHGYATFFAGKWHLGEEGHWPTDQGFNINIGGNAKGSPPGGYYSPWNNPTLESAFDHEYLTERLTHESTRFLETRDPDVPFLLYLSYYNVHAPITPYEKQIDRFRMKAATLQGESPFLAEHDAISRTRQDNPAYASMVAAVDDSVGTILNKVEQLGLAERTVVIFFSDNGGLCTVPRAGPTSNQPLRSGKGWLYEGGIREPLIIRAPGVTAAGGVCDSPIISMDFFPTMLELSGLPIAPELHLDGTSLVPCLRGQQLDIDRALYWHYPHYHGSLSKPGAAIRKDDWKLIEFYHDQKQELYNLKNDLGEQHDLSKQMPEKADELAKLLAHWQAEIGAKMPRPRTVDSAATSTP